MPQFTHRPKGPPDPLYAGTWIDAHFYDPIDEARDLQREARDKIVGLRANGYGILLSESVRNEFLHPNTPPEIQRWASDHVFTYDLSIRQNAAYAQVRTMLQGNATLGKHDADALHICHASNGFFVTLDDRVLKKRTEIKVLFPHCWIVTPCEWMANYEHHREIAPYGEEDLRDLIG